MQNNVQIFKSKPLVLDEKYLHYIRDFVNFTSNCIGLKHPIKLVLVDKNYSGIKTTGSYSDYTIKVIYEGRALVDIIRSIAHEMIHQMQDEHNVIPANPQDIGGIIENEANIYPGILIKFYVKLKGCNEIYKL